MALRRALGPWVVVVVVGCSSSVDEGGGAPADGLGGAGGGVGGAGGGDCPGDEWLITTVDGVVCGFFSESSQFEAPADFDVCGDSAPNTACSLTDFCAVMGGCGSDHSMFDENGCRRAHCETDDDCPAAMHCFQSSADEYCIPAEYACAPVDDTPCMCQALLNCGDESHCVDD